MGAVWWGIYGGIVLIAGLAALAKGRWWGVLMVFAAAMLIVRARREAGRGSW